MIHFRAIRVFLFVGFEGVLTPSTLKASTSDQRTGIEHRRFPEAARPDSLKTGGLPGFTVPNDFVVNLLVEQF